MNKLLPDALEDCLQRMKQGESLDSVLAYYPTLASQLRPLLETAVRARAAGREDLPLGVLARQRSRGLTLAADLHKGKNYRMVLRRSWRPALTVLAVISLLVMSTNGLLLASAHAIPGDTLYPLKRSVESTQLRLVSDPAKKVELENTFSQRRVDETKSLISEERVESVDFTGVVSSQSDGQWLVSDIPVQITSRTEIDKRIVVGNEVEVSGSTNSTGGVVAIRLSLAEDHEQDSELPGVSPTQTTSPEDGHPEDAPAPNSLPEESHPEVSPTQPSSTENGYMESSPAQTSSSEGDHSESSPTQISSSEDGHPESSQTWTPIPESSSQESSPTRTPAPAGSD